MYAHLGNGADGVGREKIVEEGKVGAKTGMKVLVCGDEVGENDVFTIMDETPLPGGGKRLKEKGKLKEMAEMGFQSRLGQDQSVVFIVSWCVMDLRLKVWL